ncbi:glycosyltransferase family 2 protein [Algoriphagus boritolerans]|uniref:glycosyltransferase family 2 protein n=1 Tax=Algoriphagus boritolerans TaxID=308111 RepID=UPI002FCE65D1
MTGLVRYFSDQPVTDGYQAYERWINQINLSGVQFENIYRECVIASPNWMTRREVLDSIGGFAELRYPEDYDLVFRWYAYGVDFVVVPEVTLLWREHPKRTSRNSKNYSQSAFFDLKIGAFLRLDFRGDQLIIWGKNKKSRLISRILREKGIPFENHDQEEFKKSK